MTKAAAKPPVSKDESGDARTRLLSQKTELIGQLAEGMANQFNNIMMAVTSYAELELKKAAPGERRSLEQIVSNSARAASLIQKLLAFTRKNVGFSRRLHLNDVITELSGMLHHLASDQIEVALSLDPAIQEVQADQLEIEQLLLSLAMNARNEMGRGGSLTIATKLVDKSDGEGRYAMLSVYGVEAGLATQKRDDDLVLTTPHTFEKDYNLTIYLPALGQDASESSEPSASAKSLSARTILVVEDDDAVRVPAADFLKMEGFKVLQARTGGEAMHVALRNRSPLDLLITDLVMPEMGGHEVAEKLLEMHPNLKVLYMSGDAHQAASSQIREPYAAVLQKPFRLNKLNDKIRDLLGS
jgi:CheY-like chemotaxis protein